MSEDTPGLGHHGMVLAVIPLPIGAIVSFAAPIEHSSLAVDLLSTIGLAVYSFKIIFDCVRTQDLSVWRTR
jgi:hypothetical protein